MSRTRRIIEAEVAASTLVIHKDDRSTDFLKAIYEGLGYTVINGNINRAQLMAQIKKFPRVFMLGHGGPGGLFAAGYLIDAEFGAELAKKRDGLFIWCNADAYARKHKLTGLVSGMFISEVGEASMFGIDATQKEVDASNAAFSKAVRTMLDTGQPPATVRDCYKHATCKIPAFNNERLYIFEQGEPDVPLHPTSMAHPPPPRAPHKEWTWPKTEPDNPDAKLQNYGEDPYEEWEAQVLTELRDRGVDLDAISNYEYNNLMDEIFDCYRNAYDPKETVAWLFQEE